MRRSGFTLFEMVIVMAIIVVAVGIAVPFVDSMMNPSQVTAAVDTVRQAWEQTRNFAMEEGRPYRFSIVDGGNTFRIEADDVETNNDIAPDLEGILPESCLFVPNGTGLVDLSAAPSQGGSWTPKVVFLPTGMIRGDADIEMSVGRPGLPAVTLKLSFITGSVTQSIMGKDGAR